MFNICFELKIEKSHTHTHIRSHPESSFFFFLSDTHRGFPSYERLMCTGFFKTWLWLGSAVSVPAVLFAIIPLSSVLLTPPIKGQGLGRKSILPPWNWVQAGSIQIIYGVKALCLKVSVLSERRDRSDGWSVLFIFTHVKELHSALLQKKDLVAFGLH